MLGIRRRLFARYTDSAKRVIFYAMHGAVERGAGEIEPNDILLGLARDKHHDECGFRFLHERREDLALAVGLEWPSLANCREQAKKKRPPLSAGSKSVLRIAHEEAEKSRQYWIDTDHLQVGLLLLEGPAAMVLEGIGYTIASTRQQGTAARLQWPPRQPTLAQRMRGYPTSLWVIVGGIVGVLITNLYFLIRNHV